MRLPGNQDRWRRDRSWRQFGHGIALKLVSAERRKQAKDPPAVDTDSNQSAKPSPELAVTEATDTVLWVRQALDRLELMDREVLMLREYEQLSYTEIAQLLRRFHIFL